jgi:hypothetical protein
MTVPSFDSAGHVTGLRVLMPICSGVHAFIPWAAAGFSVMPSGSVTLALRTCELSMPLALGSCGTIASVVIPSG